MSKFKRRDFLKATAGVAAGGALGAGSALFAADAQAQQYKVTPEKGAKLRILRWKRFVQGDEDMWAENTKKFTQATGIEVRIDAEGWEDVRPKAAVAANVGSGPDVINGPETIAALEYAKQLYETFVPGTLSWLDPNNNKAFLDNQIGMTTNGISIYYAAKNSQDPKVKEMAADIGHANLPVGPVGKTTELNLFFPMMVFKSWKYPTAPRAYLAS